MGSPTDREGEPNIKHGVTEDSREENRSGKEEIVDLENQVSVPVFLFALLRDSVTPW
jgi:hypothetical protein